MKIFPNDYEKNKFNDVYAYKEEDLETLEVPVLRLNDSNINLELQRALEIGAFWVDVGKKS